MSSFVSSLELPLSTKYIYITQVDILKYQSLLTPFVQKYSLFIINGHDRLMNRLAKGNPMFELESSILHQALEAFRKETGIDTSVIAIEKRDESKAVDAIITLNGIQKHFAIEIKKWSNNTNVATLIHQMQRFESVDNAILISQHINSSMAEKLKQENIQFIDTAGNAYIKQLPIYIYVRGNKPASNILAPSSSKLGSAFKSKGLKVIYELLSHPEMINSTYREIAENSQVALGTVGNVIDDLVTQGYMTISKNNKQRYLDKKEELFKKWVDAYPTQIKAKQNTRLFTSDNPSWWETLDIEALNGLWGGEIAAAKYTQFLNPKNAIVYMDASNANQLIKSARLRKASASDKHNIIIEIVEPFLPLNQIQGPIAGLADPSIVYADLVSTDDSRNHETAERLHEKYLR